VDQSIIFITLDQNFWTGNPSRSSKVSKDSDCRLVSNKYISKILPSNSLGPGPGEVGQGGLKVIHLWHHSQKIRNPQPKNVFSLQTTRLAEFEPLNSSLPLSAPELRSRKATCDLVVLAWKCSKCAGRERVKTFWLSSTRSFWSIEQTQGSTKVYSLLMTSHAYMYTFINMHLTLKLKARNAKLALKT